VTSTRTSPRFGPLGSLKRYFSSNTLLAITASVGGLVILGLTAASAGIYDAVAEKDGISGLDQPALNQVIAWRTPLANHLWTGFTHLGGALGMTLIAGAITLLMVWRWRSLTPLILMIIAVAGRSPSPESARRSSAGRGRHSVTPYHRTSTRFPFRPVTR